MLEEHNWQIGLHSSVLQEFVLISGCTELPER